MYKFLRSLIFERVVIIFLVFLFIVLPNGIITLKGQLENTTHQYTINTLYSSLNYSTYLGGSDNDIGFNVAVASDSSYYVTGGTYSSLFPTLNAFDYTFNGGDAWGGDAFIAKFSSNGVLLWSTYFGGSGGEVGYGIAVTSDGSCYVTGITSSSNFPTLNAYNSTFGGNGDAFVAKFSSIGSLLWSTYLGGIEQEYSFDIAVAGDGSCCVSGDTWSSNFPTLNAYNSTSGGNSDAFVTKFSASGSLLWSTFLGGSNNDYAQGVAIGSDSSCYVTGYTWSSNFPTLNAYNSTSGGNSDAFVTKFSASGSLLWSTYLGGSTSDIGLSIAVATNNDCFITGKTSSSDFPTLNASDSTYGGAIDAFVTKFNATGSLLRSSFLGGSQFDSGEDIAIAINGSCYVTGYTSSDDFPTLNAYDKTFGGSNDVFVSKIDNDGFLNWSTYLGCSYNDRGLGIANASDVSCLVTGSTTSSDFPIKNAHDSTFNGNHDVFLAKIIEAEDFTAPIIQDIQNIPSSPTDLNIVTINCSVSDDISGISFVTLYYQVNSDSWIKTNMTNIAGTTYEVTIGPFSYEDEIKYYIYAVDISGKNSTDDNAGSFYSFSILSGDVTGPLITNIRHSPEYPIENDTITISCTTIDLNDIQNVTLFYRLNGGIWQTKAMTISALDTYQASLDLTLNIGDLVEYYIEAVDNSPNHNVATNNNNGHFYEFVMQAPSSISQKTSAFGFFSFIFIFPIIVVVLRKRWK